jgi:hypothetical protein
MLPALGQIILRDFYTLPKARRDLELKLGESND